MNVELGPVGSWLAILEFPNWANPLPKKANWVAHLRSRGLRKSLLFKAGELARGLHPTPRDRALIFLAPIPKDEA
jgi:hypothetical protein